MVGIADSDSYVKWGASILERMPDGWDRSLTVIRTDALPSAAQLASALVGTRFAADTTPCVDLADLAELVAREQPDVVLLSVRGPVVRVLVRAIVAAMPGNRPVIVSGLPGISIPETLNALYYRSQADLFVLHSKREIRSFGTLARELGIAQEFGLATLPFLTGRSASGAGGEDIVFAAQAKVPRMLEDRERLVQWLIDTAVMMPDRRIVVKLRGIAGEPQTHSERHPFDVLLAARADVPENLVVSTGPMSDHLGRAAALVTVSSTAAIEAIAQGVPVLALDDFGVTARLINVVFEGSGLLGDSVALLRGEFRRPSEGWLDENYFHSPSDETWVAAIEALVDRRARGQLPLRPQFRGNLGGSLRRVWDRKRALGRYDHTLGGYAALAVGLPLRGVVRRYRSVQAAANRRRDAAELHRVE